jgi:copper chaperone
MLSEHVAFNVEDMTCEKCASTIQGALSKLNGIMNIIVDLDMKRVAVEYDVERLNFETLRGTIEDAGYKVK